MVLIVNNGYVNHMFHISKCILLQRYDVLFILAGITTLI